MNQINGIVGGKIYTLNKPDETVNAVLVDNGVITELTTTEQAITNSPPNANLLHVQGYTVLPGFIDSHLHVLSLGKKLDQLNLQDTTSITELQQKLKEYAKHNQSKSWILGYGWDQGIFNEKRYPTKHDLDQVIPDKPVYLWRACHHIAVANSKALELAGITAQTQPPDGGKIDKDENGEPTGILRENAMNLIIQILPRLTDHEKTQFIKKALQYLNSVGITSVQTNDPETYNLYKTIEHDLTVRIYLTPSIDELPSFKAQNMKTGDGSPMLRLGRFKLFADGSLGAETAALQEPYQGSTQTGMLLYSDDELHKQLQAIKDAQCQPEVHAIGDRAAKQVTTLYSKIFTKHDRPVLTHCQVLDPAIITIMKEHGIIANIQPIFINTDMRWAASKLGEKRMQYSYAWRTIMSNEVIAAGGSDAPIEPPNPLYGIHAAVNRQDLQGNPPNGWYPQEKLTPWQAFQLFTINAAYAEYQEHKKGKIMPGYYADFIILDKDPFTCDPKALKDIKILATIVNGNLVYNNLTGK